MKVGSYRDVGKWVAYPGRWSRVPLLRKSIVISALSYALWRALRWALLPGFWQGNLFGGGDTLLETARHHFGPILIVRTWISDPSAVWGKLTPQQELEVFHMWGYYESAARFKLIIAVLWVGMCLLVLAWRSRAVQPSGAPNGGHATQLDRAGATDGPPSVS